MSKMNDLRSSFDADRTYTQHELTEMADEWLREDARSELCRECGGRGEEAGDPVEAPQEARDEAGNHLVIHWPKYECANGHMWYAGEGSVRGIGGDNPVLFEEHFQSRRRREIYNCVSADTECLDRTRGWITEAEVTAGDEILIFDPGSGTTRWGELLQVHRYSHAGSLLRLHGQGLDCLATEEHRWPVMVFDKQRRFKGFEVRTTESLSSKRSSRALLLGARSDHPEQPVFSDAFVRLQAWNLTEGHVWGRDTSLRTAITQSHTTHPENVAAIRADIETVGACFDQRRPGANTSSRGFARADGLWCREALTQSGATQFVLSGKGIDPFLAVGGRCRAPTPTFYSKLTESQQDEYNRVLMLGDGLQGGQMFSQYDATRMDSAAVAFTLGGHATSRTACGNHVVVANWDGTRGGKKWLHRLHMERVPYTGDIWCPTTTTGYWLARRNGKTFITGNSLGSPDPSIVSGIYNRAHPQGRKINTPEARAKHGASYYR